MYRFARYFHHTLKQKTIKSLSFLMLFFSCLGYLVCLPDYVPNWQLYENLSVALCLISQVLTIFYLVRNFHARYKLLFASSVVSIAALAWTFFSFVSLCFLSGEGFMGPIYRSTVELNNLTVYVYDAGFLDPATQIRVRNSSWPTMQDIGKIPDSPSQVQLRMEGTQLIVVAGHHRLTYDVATKRVLSH